MFYSELRSTCQQLEPMSNNKVSGTIIPNNSKKKNVIWSVLLRDARLKCVRCGWLHLDTVYLYSTNSSGRPLNESSVRRT